MTQPPEPLPGSLAGAPQSADDVHVRSLDRWQADDHREALADLFVECYPRMPGEEFNRRQGFLDRLEADVRQEEFRMVIAETADPVGCAYGYPVDREGAWWPAFDGGLPAEVEQLTAAGQVFAVAELMVHPDHRRHGVARNLYRQLLGDLEAALGAVLLYRTDVHATAFLEHWGWRVIGTTTETEDVPALQGLVCELE